MSPIIVDNLCIAHFGGNDGGEIMAFDLNTGTEKWKCSGDGPAYGSPTLLTMEGTKQVVLQTGNNIVSIAVADGRQLWQAATPPQRRFYNCATTIINGQTVIYTGHGLGTKAMMVQKQGNNYTLKELWSNAELGTAYNTPVLKDGMLFGLSDRGRLYCMNAGTGQITWADESSHKNFGAVLDGGSVILALPSESELIAFAPSSEEYKELARIKVADTPVYAHPVVAGNRMYIKDNESLTMLTIN